MAAALTRRQLAAAALSASALVGQAPSPPLPQNADEELKGARDQNRQISEVLRKFPILITAEPAAHFKA